VRKQKEPAAEFRGRERRSALLQRVLYLAFRTTVFASHTGVAHVHEGKTLVAFPRLLLYMSDQPEEKAVLCLKGGNCRHPCSTCTVRVEEAGAPAALSAKERDAVTTVERQLEGSAHKRYQRESVPRAELEEMDSAHNRLPVVAGMAGMTTAPFMMYESIGFDALHVRSLFRFVCVVAYHLILCVGECMSWSCWVVVGDHEHAWTLLCGTSVELCGTSIFGPRVPLPAARCHPLARADFGLGCHAPARTQACARVPLYM